MYLNLNFKINNGKGKVLLRNILNKYLPNDLYERPKMGFGIPLSNWIKGPLLEWSKDLLNPNSLKEDGFFNPIIVQKIFNEHLHGQRNWESFIWDILMFQSWMEHN